MKIVIIGGGYAGVLTAKKLAKLSKKRKTIDITLIDKNSYHTMLTELHEVVGGRVEQDNIKIDLNKIFYSRPVRIVQDEILSVDKEKRTVYGKKKAYDYDILVVATGSQPTYFNVKGAKENAFPLWSFDDAVRLKEHIEGLFCSAKNENNKIPIFVIGAGFTGVETAGEIAEYVPILCKKYGVSRERAEIYLIDLLDRVIPTLPQKLSSKVQKRLEKMGVKVMLKTNVTEISQSKIFLDKKSFDTQTVIWAAGIEGAEISQNMSEKNLKGRLKTDAFLRCTDYPEIFAVGDCLYYEYEGSCVPRMVENAEQSAEICAHNIFVTAFNKGSLKEYKPSFHGVMVCVGSRYGVARVGFKNKMFNLPSFLAMFAKHFINIVYFCEVCGYNKVASYIKHEFIDIKHRRSFLGGLFAIKLPAILCVPLRVWLGAVWVFEGVMKIVGGWFSTPQLKSFFEGANSFYDSILNNTARHVSLTTDALSAATGAGGQEAESMGRVIFNLPIFNIVRFLFVCGADLSKATTNDFAFKIDVPLLDVFINNVVLPSATMQMTMQIVIVIAEILIGFAIMGGLFTFWALLVSLILQMMFITTTGLYLNTFWMIFAAIALLINSGRCLGLDYYASPLLKKGWKALPFVRRWYIYHD
ncbi:MAG: NAD(P)/FAD-dependent oxidoreductase [Ruminococcaceae bacterium]|nr:NAD(P)/FAD-dependent oxidoreductase [Oscillospiraceae bacterium]